MLPCRDSWLVWAVFVAVACLVIGMGGLAAFGYHVRNPRTVVAAVAPNGMVLRVVQTCNWSAEPFTTAVYYHRPDGERWGWFYYDHQDDYWGAGHAEIDAPQKRIRVYRGQRLTATFAWESERFVLLREGCAPRESIGAQEWVSSPPF